MNDFSDLEGLTDKELDSLLESYEKEPDQKQKELDLKKNIEAITRGIQSGLIVGPHLEAGLEYLFGNKPTYSTAFQDIKKRQSELQKESPYLYGLSEFIGGAPLPVAKVKQLGNLGSAALTGALYGAGSKVAEKANPLDAELENVAYSGTVGGLSGAAFHKLLNRFSPQERAPITKDVQERYDLIKKYDFPASVKQIRQAPGDLLTEEFVKKGKYGAYPKEKFLELKELQKSALEKEIDEYLIKVGKVDVTEKHGEPLQKIFDKLHESKIKREKEIDALYNRVAKKNTYIPAKDFKNHIESISKYFDSLYQIDKTAPQTSINVGQLKNLVKTSKGDIPFKGYHEIHKLINDAIYDKNLSKTDATFLNRLKDKNYKFLENIESKLEGNDNSINLFKVANKKYSELKKDYGDIKASKQTAADKVVNKIMKKYDNNDPLTLTELSNSIFGSGNKFDQNSSKVIAKLKNLLPKKEIDELKGEAILKISKNITENSTSPTKFKNALNSILIYNKELMKELFNDNEINKLKELNNLAKIAYSDKVLQNPSGSATTLIELSSNLLEKIPKAGKAIKYLTNYTKAPEISKKSLEQAFGKSSKQPSSPFMRSIPEGTGTSLQRTLMNETGDFEYETSSEPNVSLDDLTDEQLEYLLKEYD